MRQPGRAERVLEARVDLGVVAVDQRGHQGPLVGGSVRHRVTECLPDRAGSLPPQAWWLDDLDLTAGPEQPSKVAVVGRQQPTVQPHGRAERHPRVVRIAQDQHRGDQVERATPAGNLMHGEPPDHLVSGERLPATGDHVRVGGDRADCRDRGAVAGEARHRVVGGAVRPERGHGGGGGGDEQQCGCGHHHLAAGSSSDRHTDRHQDQTHEDRDQRPAGDQRAGHRTEPRRRAEQRHPQVEAAGESRVGMVGHTVT